MLGNGSSWKDLFSEKDREKYSIDNMDTDDLVSFTKWIDGHEDELDDGTWSNFTKAMDYITLG